MAENLLSSSLPALASSRKLNHDKIESIDQDIEVAVKNILKELQNMREIYEDGILFFYNLKSPFDSIEQGFEKLMEGLKRHISLQESLFKAADEPMKVPPSSLVSIKYEPDNGPDHRDDEPEDDHVVEPPDVDPPAVDDSPKPDGAVRLEIFSNSMLPGTLDNEDIKIKIETDEPVGDDGDGGMSEHFLTNDFQSDSTDGFLWPDDTDSKPLKVKHSNVKVKQEKGDSVSSRKKSTKTAGSTTAVTKKRKNGTTYKQPVKCDQCFRELVNMQSLKNHMEWHKREKRSFECATCGKKFKIEACFKKHQESHFKVKKEERTDRFRCEYCAKGFDNQGNLAKHLKTHTGEKPHACDLCESAFITHFKLREHMRTHTGEKPFECEDCGRMFSTKNLRQRHRNSSHLGIKPYSCKLCGKAFARSDHLKQHIGQMHTKLK